jgi:uncharacterized membrane protein YkvA (DUF1232 family)
MASDRTASEPDPAALAAGEGVMDALRRLAQEARAKLVGLSQRSYERLRRIAPLLRLLEAYADGRYREVPERTLWAIIFAVAYFVWPADAIPDVIAAIGFADDAAVLAFVLQAIRDDLDRFLAWERAA